MYTGRFFHKAKIYIQKYSTFLSVILSFLSVCSFTYAFKVGGDSVVISNSVISIVLLLSFYPVIRKAICLISKRLFMFSFCSGWALSAMLIIGTEVHMTDGISLNLMGVLIKLVVITSLSFIISSFMILLLYYLPGVRERMIFKENKSRLCKKYLSWSSRKSLLYIWAFIFICWIPAFLAYFPGIFAYDTPWQVDQAFQHAYNAHHPLVHTLYLYFCLKVGGMLGSYNIGVAIHSISQMLMMSLAFSFACCYMRRLRVPVIIQTASILYFALIPFHAILSINATKDILFSAAILIVFILFLDMVLNTAEFFDSWKSQLLFVACITIMALLRNNGIHVFIVCIPFLMVTFRRYFKKITILCLASLLIYFSGIGALNRIFDVQKGDIGAAFCIPLQQLARAFNYNGEELTEEEKLTFYEIIPEIVVGHYNPRLADPIKFDFNETNFKKDKLKYIKLWVEVGLKCPGTYIDAFLANNFGFWYPDVILPDPVTSQNYIETSIKTYENIKIERNSLMPELEKLYDKIAIDTIQQKVPVFSMLFSPGFSFWILFIGSAICMYFKRYKLLLPMAVLYALWLTLLLSPIVLFRYAYPICVCIPTIIAVLFNKTEMFTLTRTPWGSEQNE